MSGWESLQPERVAPGSEQHERLRAGKISGSRVHRLMEGSTATVATLLTELRKEAEVKVGGLGGAGSKATDWGNTHEGRAIAEYEVRAFVETTLVAWLQHPIFPDFVGVSPDAVLLDADGVVRGGVEAKNPYVNQNHLHTLMYKTVPEQYKWQLQLTLACAPMATEWAFVSHDPREIPERRLSVINVRPDPKLQDQLFSKLQWAVGLLKSGDEPEFKALPNPLNHINF